MVYSGSNLFLMIYIFVQIIVESFPVSSSSHVRIVEWLWRIDFQVLFPHYLDHLLHGPTLLIVMIFFRKRWIQPVKMLCMGLLKGWCRGTYSYVTRRLLMIMQRVSGLLAVTTLLAIFGYVLVALFLKPCAWYSGVGMVFVGFVVTISILFSLYWEPHINNGILDWRTVLFLGSVQAVSLLPGISRFASTYGAARWMRLSPRRAFEISFLMELPLLVMAFVINGIGGFIKEPIVQLSTFPMISLIGVATVLAYVGLWLMWTLALGRRLWIMGFYMIVPMSIILYFLAQ